MPKKEMSSEQIELFNELKKLAKRANQRIVRLEREFGKETWATKKLRNKLAIEPLQAWTVSGRVKVNKSMTVLQLQKTIKATQQFLDSKTSTIGGVKKVRIEQIKEIQKRFDIKDREFTYEDAENFYDVFDDEYNWILQYVTPSEFQGFAQDSIEAKDNESDWVKRIEENIIEIGNDLDLVSKCIRLYDKFVAPYI